jgi:transposase
MDKLIRIGIDTSKRVFQLHGVGAAEQTALRKKVRRKDVVAFLAQQAPTEIGMEACGGSHHWARVIEGLGHRVKLIAPQLVKPYVKRGKNDAADAEAVCEAMSRPGMRFVAAKSAEQQAALMLIGVRDRLVQNRTQLTNAIRGYAAEFGLIAPKGLEKIDDLLARAQADETLPELARALFAIQAREYAGLQGRLREMRS